MELLTILNTLNKLEKMHRSLLEIALKKTEFVKANDIEQMDLILKSEQSHVAAIETLELQRQSQVAEYLQQNGVFTNSNPTISDLIEASKADEHHEALVNVREGLIEIVQKLKAQNDLNQKLVYQSMQVVNFTINMLNPRQTEEQVNYSDKEVLGTSSVQKKSYFDSQA